MGPNYLIRRTLNEFPLCDLEAVEAGTETGQLVSDYAMWFANR